MDWIAKTFGNGSSHIQQVVAGRHKDLTWSRAQLARAGERIITLYDKVALRESLGDQVSKAAKRDMLESEFRALASIRISLHVIRLGADGAHRFRQKVEDEDARSDFELISGNSRSYKIFSKELASAQKAKMASSTRKENSRGHPSRAHRSRTGRPRKPRFERPLPRKAPARSRYRHRRRQRSGGGSDGGATYASDRHKSKATKACLLYTSPSPRDYAASRMPSSA